MAGQKTVYQREAEARDAASRGTSEVKADKSEAEHQAALGKERKGFSAGAAGADTGAGGDPMPKQSDYPDMAAFGAAMRAWREKRGRAGAVKNKLGATP